MWRKKGQFPPSRLCNFCQSDKRIPEWKLSMRSCYFVRPFTVRLSFFYKSGSALCSITGKLRILIFWTEKLSILPIGQKDSRMRIEYEKQLFHSSLHCSSFVLLQKLWCTVFGKREIKNFDLLTKEIKHFANRTKGSHNESSVWKAAVLFVPLLFISCFSTKWWCTVFSKGGI